MNLLALQDYFTKKLMAMRRLKYLIALNPNIGTRDLRLRHRKLVGNMPEKVLKIKDLISLIHPDNIASKRVAEKLGAKNTKVTFFLGAEHEIHVY